MGTTYFLKIGFSYTRTQGSATFVLPSCARLSRPSMRPEFRILLDVPFLNWQILLQATISEISKLCNRLATENQAHKAEIDALNKRFEMDKAKVETKNAAQLAEFIQSDMWEVVTNGTTVSSKVLSFSLNSKQGQQKWQSFWKKWGSRNWVHKMSRLYV